MRLFIARRLHLLALLSLAACLVGQLGSLHWFLELFSHFLPHYALIFALAALATRGRKRLIWLVLGISAALWLAQPLQLWRQTPPAPAHSLIWYNVHLNNRDAQGESARLIQENARILALGEINLADTGWQTLRAHYPHGCEHREHSPFALAVWSQTPLADCAVHFVDDFPYIRAVQSDGTAIFALHPPPPISPALAEARTRYLDTAANHIARENRAVVAGDLNASPFSPLMRAFVRTGGVQYTTAYAAPTWKPFFLNIDHILMRNLAGRSRLLPWHASDHRPLRVDY